MRHGGPVLGSCSSPRVPDDQIAADVARWRSELPLTAEQLAFVALRALLTEGAQAGPPGPGEDGEAPDESEGLENHG
jgi:hypothetical protein